MTIHGINEENPLNLATNYGDQYSGDMIKVLDLERNFGKEAFVTVHNHKIHNENLLILAANCRCEHNGKVIKLMNLETELGKKLLRKALSMAFMRKSLKFSGLSWRSK